MACLPISFEELNKGEQDKLGAYKGRARQYYSDIDKRSVDMPYVEGGYSMSKKHCLTLPLYAPSLSCSPLLSIF